MINENSSDEIGKPQNHFIKMIDIISDGRQASTI